MRRRESNDEQVDAEGTLRALRWWNLRVTDESDGCIVEPPKYGAPDDEALEEFWRRIEAAGLGDEARAHVARERARQRDNG